MSGCICLSSSSLLFGNANLHEHLLLGILCYSPEDLLQTAFYFFCLTLIYLMQSLVISWWVELGVLEQEKHRIEQSSGVVHPSSSENLHRIIRICITLFSFYAFWWWVDGRALFHICVVWSPYSLSVRVQYFLFTITVGQQWQCDKHACRGLLLNPSAIDGLAIL